MARTALVFALCALLAAAASAADFASIEETLAESASDELQAPQEAQAEELRAGQEQAQQVLEQQSDADVDAPQGEEQEQRAAAEQQSWQAQQSRQNPVWQSTNEGTAGRLQQGQQQGQWTGQQNQQTNQQPNQWQAQPGQQGQQGQQFNWQGQPTNAATQRPANSDFGLQSGGGAGSQSWWPPAPPPTGQKQPPAGYTPLETFGWVKAYEKPRAWLEAASACWADGAQLAVAESEEEARALGTAYGRVKALVKGSEDKNLFFVGANDIAREGYFVTLHGTKFSPKTWLNNGQNRAHTWQKGEPNNHKKKEHCVMSNDKGYYWDGNCQSKFAFICQFKDRCQPTHRTGSLQQTETPRKY